LINCSYFPVIKHSANPSGLYLAVCVLVFCVFDILVDVCSLLVSSSSSYAVCLEKTILCAFRWIRWKWSQYKSVIKLLFAEIASGRKMSRSRVLLHSLKLKNLGVWQIMSEMIHQCLMLSYAALHFSKYLFNKITHKQLILLWEKHTYTNA
jgi:hypothetical protein